MGGMRRRKLFGKRRKFRDGEYRYVGRVSGHRLDGLLLELGKGGYKVRYLTTDGDDKLLYTRIEGSEHLPALAVMKATVWWSSFSPATKSEDSDAASG